MRTTIDLPDETFHQLKEPVTQPIERGLAANGAHPAAASTSMATPTAAASPRIYTVPIARVADGSVRPYLSNAQIQALLDDDERLPAAASRGTAGA